MPLTADEIETARVAIYSAFAGTGRAPTVPELGRLASLSETDARGALLALHKSRDIVLSSDALAAATANSDAHDSSSTAIEMAHPFASVPLGFSVMGASTLWWGGCCWDAFALPHLLPEQAPVLVATRCPGCKVPLSVDVGTDKPPALTCAPATTVAHFLVPMAHAWDDVVHTCGHQNLFCAESCLDAWLVRTGREKGYVMNTDTLWYFAKGWYAGRLERGYKRREPSQAKDYFRSVGLSGPFWGLE